MCPINNPACLLDWQILQLEDKLIFRWLTPSIRDPLKIMISWLSEAESARIALAIINYSPAGKVAYSFM